MHAARPTHRLRSKRPAICSRCLQPVGMGVVRVGSQLRVPCSGPGAARVSRVRGGGAALPSQATCAKINGGYVMWVARWCVSLLRVTDAMFAAVFEREAQRRAQCPLPLRLRQILQLRSRSRDQHVFFPLRCSLISSQPYICWG